MIGTKEFQDIMMDFEKYMKSSNISGHKLDREKIGEAPRGCFYQDGYINNLFVFYMAGYQMHKCISNLDK